MTLEERRERQIRTFLLHVGIQIHQYGDSGIPEGAYRELARRATELGLKLEDLEPEPKARKTTERG